MDTYFLSNPFVVSDPSIYYTIASVEKSFSVLSFKSECTICSGYSSVSFRLSCYFYLIFPSLNTTRRRTTGSYFNKFNFSGVLVIFLRVV